MLSKAVASLRFHINRHLKFDVVRSGGHRDLPSHLRKILHDYRVDTVIDVGANVGQFGKLTRSLGYKGMIHSFEPVESAFSELSKEAAKDRRWVPHKMAVG